ncbi:hypothetical protein ACFFMR_29155 [Micromonospora andamanensis]|uniref:Uncharacterized protein n=1 Tax=Micromonospora andamanensis TaxID=1287068 RepID=A0ABQ4HS28_9ACTN|nr:hypothetical protein [Micromonospora andamanensis]GIJ08443.1 hypothetical protein Van01_16570 [Micromonospora andamanensis]
MSRFLYFDLPAVAAHAQHAVLCDRNLHTRHGASGIRSAEPALRLFRFRGMVWLASNGGDALHDPMPSMAKARRSLAAPGVRLPDRTDAWGLPLLRDSGPQLVDLITAGLPDGADLFMVDPNTLTIGVGRQRPVRASN